MRCAAAVLVLVLAVSACGDGDAAIKEPAATTATAGHAVGGVTIRHDDGCAYEGPVEFDLNSDVTFTFINTDEGSDAGFAVHKIDAGTTAEDILELGVFAVSDEDSFYYEPYLPSGMTPDVEYQLTVTLDRIGLHALICFQQPEGRPHYATLFTVNG
jgi:hypothetical protein